MKRSQQYHQQFFLGIEKSLSGYTWIENLNQKLMLEVKSISQKHQLPELISRILAARNVKVDQASSFLNPSLQNLMPNPLSLTDMDKASQRLSLAIQMQERITIFGDYDVDGATSAALLYRFLNHFGICAEIYIPDRIDEGYGPNPKAIDKLIKNGTNLIVTVDCGTTSFNALQVAYHNKCDVLVLDHHQVNDELPPAFAIVNPNRNDDISNQEHLAAVGVVFLTLVATLKELKNINFPGSENCNLLHWLDLVALGTVCDMVPLKGVNRAYIQKGLIVCRHGTNLGLNALIESLLIHGPITPYHFSFLIGPRINAGGRIGDASLGTKLLICEDLIQIEALVSKLNELNKERQNIENEMLLTAICEAEKDIGQYDKLPVLITSHENWHPGIVGLIASRLKERFYRPSFAISFDKTSGLGTGSARSIPGIDIGQLVRFAVEEKILIKGGGHKMAAGLTIDQSKLSAFRSFIENYLSQTMQNKWDHPSLKIDGAITADAVTPELINTIDRAGPYGSEHSEPIFVFPTHKIHYCEIVGENHIRIRISSGYSQKLDAIAFRAVGTPLGQALLDYKGKNMHLAGVLSLDYWGGRPKPKIRIIDAAIPNKRSLSYK